MAKTKRTPVLKVGDTVSIYTDFQNQKDYEGKAILVTKISDGDSFYSSEERLIPDEKKEYSDLDTARLDLYTRIRSMFNKDPGLLDMLVKCRRYANNYDRRMSILNDPSNYLDDKVSISSLDKDAVIRYVEQLNPDWQNTIYMSEKWKVKFTEDKDGWPIEFTTTRNIRVRHNAIKNKNYTSKYTTYNSKTSLVNHIDEKQPIPNNYHNLLSDRSHKLF